MKSMFCTALAICLLVAALPERVEAFGAETLKCLVSPDPNPVWKTPICRAKQAKFSYVAKFQVFDGTGTYTYAWDKTTWNQYGTVTNGCGSTDAVCWYSVASSNLGDRTIPMAVIITQGAQQRTLTVSVYLPAVCEFVGDPVWC